VLCAGALATAPAAANQMYTTIDLDYLYEQRNEFDDVKASTSFLEKYELKYETSLTTAFDFLGAVRLELDDKWYTSEADTSKVAPTLELQAKSSQTAVRIVYEGVVQTTDSYQEAADSETFSSNMTAELLMAPVIWPEFKLKLQRRRDYQEATTDRTIDTFEGTVLKDFNNTLRVEFNLKNEGTTETLPAVRVADSTEWTGKATYKEILYGGTEFEAAYEIKETYKTEELRDVFTTATETYEQKLKTRLKNSLVLTPRLTVRASWEYGFDQDLLVLDYDYKVTNKFLLDGRWDMMDWLKVAAEAKRETETQVFGPGEDDKEKLTDSLRGTVDIAPVEWLALGGKAELRREQTVDQLTGSSVDVVDEQKYEVTLKNRIGDWWDLTLSGIDDTEHTDGWLTHRETRVRGDVRMSWRDLFSGDLIVQPSYEAAITTDWDTAKDNPTSERQDREAKIKFEYRMRLLDLFAATFSHEYGVKISDEFDDVLVFERTLQMNEDTRLNVVFTEIIRDLRLEGEIDRKGSDEEHDTDPELVDVSYALKLDWKKDEFQLSSAFKYDDKGDTFDSLIFNTRVGWRNDQFDVSGEYQYEKIYADETDETRKLNLKLNYKF
jgi:hypothetical protein